MIIRGYIPTLRRQEVYSVDFGEEVAREIVVDFDEKKEIGDDGTWDG
jgi:hypothetical protein